MGAAWRVEGTRSSIRSAFVLFYFKHREGGQRETLLSRNWFYAHRIHKEDYHHLNRYLLGHVCEYTPTVRLI